MNRHRLALVLLALVAPLGPAACGDDEPTQVMLDENGFAESLGVDLDAMTLTSSGLYIQDFVVGTGDEATPGKRVFVHYSGWLADGTLFDTSRNRGPFDFVLGVGDVIGGWDEGVEGMKVGGTRRLIIPPALGYGATGSGPIPPNAILVFDIELLSVSDT